MRHATILLALIATCPLASTAAGQIGSSEASSAPRWSRLFHAPGVDFSSDAMAMFDDGSGRKLYVGGNFNTAGPEVSPRLARWTGSKWEAVPVPNGFTTSILELCAFDDGSGERLFMAASYNHDVYAWDGTSWTTYQVSVGFGDVFTEVLFTDGTSLYLGGHFDDIDGISVQNIARFDGSDWHAMGSLPPQVTSLAISTIFGTPTMFAGLGLTSVQASEFLYAWDGVSWNVVSGAPDEITDLVEYPTRFGPELVIASEDNQVTSLTPSGTFIPFNAGAPFNAKTLMVRDSGETPELWVGGAFENAGGRLVRNVTYWDRFQWRALGTTSVGVQRGFINEVNDLFVTDLGRGEEVFLAGDFHQAGEREAHGIARWTPNQLRSLSVSTPPGPTSAEIVAFAEFDDGTGTKLYGGGRFWLGGTFSMLARWDGSEWTRIPGDPLQGGGEIRAMTVWDDGSGPALYIGGRFGPAALGYSGIARWDGSSWSPLDGGVGPFQTVRAFTVHDDGSGPALWVAGNFTSVGGQPALNLASWSGTSWRIIDDLGSSNVVVGALASWDDGTGTHLYAGGGFTQAGGVAASYLARWDGAAWSEVGGGMSSAVQALLPIDAPRYGGSRLVVGGSFSMAGSLPVTGGIALWDGTTWSSVPGLTGLHTDRLALWDDGGLSKLVAMGGPDRSPFNPYSLSVHGRNGWTRLGDATLVRSLHVGRDASFDGIWIGGAFRAIENQRASIGVAHYARRPSPVSLSIEGAAEPSHRLSLTGSYDAEREELVLRASGPSGARARLLIGTRTVDSASGVPEVVSLATIRVRLDTGARELRGAPPTEPEEDALLLQLVGVDPSGAELASPIVRVQVRDANR